MADAGMRSNGRWRYGSVEFPESGKSERNAMSIAGLVIDHAPDLAPEVISEEMALDAAHEFLAQIPTADELLPALTVADVELALLIGGDPR